MQSTLLSCKIMLRGLDQVFQFLPVNILRLVPGGMVKLADVAIFMHATDTTGSKGPPPEPPEPELELPELKGGMEEGVLVAIVMWDVFLSPRSISDRWLKGSKTE